MHIWLWLYATTEVISYNLSAQRCQVWNFKAELVEGVPPP